MLAEMGWRRFRAAALNAKASDRLAGTVPGPQGINVTKNDVLDAPARISLCASRDLVSGDLIPALPLEGDAVRPVVEAPAPTVARRLAEVRVAAEAVARTFFGGLRGPHGVT